MRIVKIALGVLAFFAAIGTPSKVSAQACTQTCSCSGSFCSCVGGGQWNCTVNGTSCELHRCHNGPIAFAPDGAVIRLSQFLPQLARADSIASSRRLALGPSTLRPAGWERLPDGRVVQRSCSGMIIAQYFDERTAAIMRQAQIRLLL